MYTYVRVHVQSAGRVLVHALHVPAYLLIQPGAADIWRALAEATNFAQSRIRLCNRAQISLAPCLAPCQNASARLLSDRNQKAASAKKHP